jgi:beta-glucosidase
MRRRDFLAAAAVTACGAAACRPTDETPPAGSSDAAAERIGGGDASVIPGRSRALSSYDSRVRPLVADMTLAEKLGKMTQGELGNIRDETDVERYFLGSVLSGGDADPAEGNGLLPWTNTIDRFIERSRNTRLGIPILYGVDAVHGHSNVEGAVIFPHNIGLGCTRNAALVEEAGRITALEMRATGTQWTFAPCVAVPRDIRWGRTYEGFSEDPGVTGELGAAGVRGLQTRDLSDPHAALACAKHYVGDGGTAYGPRGPGRRTLLDQGDTQLDEATLRRIHLAPYLSAIEAGVGSMMVTYSSWNGSKVSGNKRLMTEILKDELGFEGFLISDYYAIGQVDRDYKTAVELSVNGGMDMAMEPARYANFIETLQALVEEGRVPMSRIDDAVTRILRVKAAMGLLDAERSQLADRSLHASFGSAAHRDVGRRAVRESLVLLKNDGVLPLAKNARLLVAGAGADDLGMQCGGWTVRWQGQPGEVTTGTTLLEAIRATGAPGADVRYSADGALAAVDAAAATADDARDGPPADAAIVVVGETPYAEGVGDRSDLALKAEDAALVERVAGTGVPTVVVVLSGRPLVLGAALERAAAVVAAWLPGTEGQGMADVLFGDHAPTGKLSFTWPRTMEQVPVDGGTGEPAFPFGYGLTYRG